MCAVSRPQVARSGVLASTIGARGVLRHVPRGSCAHLRWAVSACWPGNALSDLDTPVFEHIFSSHEAGGGDGKSLFKRLSQRARKGSLLGLFSAARAQGTVASRVRRGRRSDFRKGFPESKKVSKRAFPKVSLDVSRTYAFRVEAALHLDCCKASSNRPRSTRHRARMLDCSCVARVSWRRSNGEDVPSTST
jgi:hypothetical protein